MEGYGVGFGDVIGHLGHFPLCRLEKGMAENESSLWGHNDGGDTEATGSGGGGQREDCQCQMRKWHYFVFSLVTFAK